jgi:hypothetical protein
VKDHVDARTIEYEQVGKHYALTYINNVPLNETHHEYKVNYIKCVETNLKTGDSKTFTWVTNIQVTDKNVFILMRIGRSRWKIENETFNTLKNQGYNFEHNYGHGKKYLNNTMAHLMMLQFLCDQVQELLSPAFQKALKKAGTKRELWHEMRIISHWFVFDSWTHLFESIAQKKVVDPPPSAAA